MLTLRWPSLRIWKCGAYGARRRLKDKGLKDFYISDTLVQTFALTLILKWACQLSLKFVFVVFFHLVSSKPYCLYAKSENSAWARLGARCTYDTGISYLADVALLNKTRPFVLSWLMYTKFSLHLRYAIVCWIQHVFETKSVGFFYGLKLSVVV